MGYLDHSTNNIILDAVLTDYGRQQLASAAGAFNISQYALADDEVDYRMIKKYGRAVGKEKIEKNTPIFEALTNPSIALKYRLVGRETKGTSISTVYMPYLVTTSTANLSKDLTTVNVKVDLQYNRSSNVPANFIQSKYDIKVPDRFLYLTNPGGGASLTQPDVAMNSVDAGDPNRVATYTFTATANQTSITFDINVRSIDNTTLTIYGKRTGSSSQRVINTYITVVGLQHGPTIDIPVTYTAQTTS
jgi:hypothetical protein